MLLHKTLYKYLFKNHLKALAQILGILVIIFFISSTIDVLNKNRSSNIPFPYLIQLISYKIPFLIQEASTLVALISSILFLDKLSRSRELIALKNTGLSLWQILLPSISLITIFGLILILFLNPLAAALLSVCEKLEVRFIKKQQNIAMLSNDGLLLHEESNHYKKIIIAENISLKDMKLNKVTLLIITKDNKYEQRIDAAYGILSNNELKLKNTIFYDKSMQPQKIEDYAVPTSITFTSIIKSFAIPEVIPLREFSRVIKQLHALGLVSLQYQNYYYKLLLKPFYMVVMVLLAACFININPRNNKNFSLLVQACIIGFVIQFATELLANILISFGIHPLLAYFVPMMFILLSSIFVILSHQEKL
ncbi:MAG: putative permease [Rickettsiaceae bacterium]|jgi:lipopolysaccharide export system permease protein|nr:putative permease [Rickettsiaceae bacterium]